MYRHTETKLLSPNGVMRIHRVSEPVNCSDPADIGKLRARLRASKEANAAKHARIIGLESENASARSQIEWLNHVADVMTKGNSGLVEDNQRLRGELKRLTTPVVTLTDNVSPGLSDVQSALDDLRAAREAGISQQDRECIGLWRALPHDLAQDVATMAGAGIGQSIVDFTIRWAHSEMKAGIQRGIDMHNAATKAAVNDETRLREMEAEDAARQPSGKAYAITPDGIRDATDEERALLGLPPLARSPTEDMIKEAAAILGDPLPAAKVDGATWDVRRSGGSLIITPADGQSIQVTEGQVVTVDLTPYGPTVRRAVADDAPGLDDVVMVPGRSAMSQSLTAEQLQCAIVDPLLSDTDAAKMHDAITVDKLHADIMSFLESVDVYPTPYMRAVAEGVTAPKITPDHIEWAPCARKALHQELARQGIHVPEATVLAWPVHHCATSRCYLDGILRAMPDFLAHYAP